MAYTPQFTVSCIEFLFTLPFSSATASSLLFTFFTFRMFQTFYFFFFSSRKFHLLSKFATILAEIHFRNESFKFWRFEELKFELPRTQFKFMRLLRSKWAYIFCITMASEKSKICAVWHNKDERRRRRRKRKEMLRKSLSWDMKCSVHDVEKWIEVWRL